jgi:hypothetical protein
MALDFGIELRRVERAADLIALQLGHVDAVGRKASHRLVERSRHVADAEDEGGDPGDLPGAGISGCWALRLMITKRVVLWAASSMFSARISSP